MDSLLQLTGVFSPWQRYFTFSDWYQNVDSFSFRLAPHWI